MLPVNIILLILFNRSILLTALGEVKLPPKLRKRGRPKGADQTVIGLPKKRHRGNKPVPFLKKLPSDKEKG